MLINGELIPDEVFRETVRKARALIEAKGPDASPLEIGVLARTLAREELIMATLIRQFAHKEDVKLLTQNLPPPSKKEMHEYYRVYREDFRISEQLRVSHIVKNVECPEEEAEAMAALENAQRELAAGRSFEEVADKYSDCPGTGGDLGYFLLGTMVEEFEAALTKLTDGEVSPIVRTRFGFHLARITGRKPSFILSFAEVHDQILQTLQQAKQREAISHYLERVRAVSDIRDVRGSQA